MSGVIPTQPTRADFVRKKLGELTTLAEMNKEIHSTMNVTELLRILVEKAIIGVNFQRGLLYLVEGDYLRCVAWLDRVRREKASIIEKRVGFRMDDKALEVLVAQTGEPIYVKEALTDKRVSPKFIKFSNTREYCAVPLIGRNGDVFGVLTGDKSYRAEPILDEDIETLSLFAGHISLAIENAMLYEEKVRFNQLLGQKVRERTEELNRANEELSIKMRELSALYQMSQLLNSSLDVNSVIRQVLFLIRRLGYDMCAIHLFEDRKPISVFCEGLDGEYRRMMPLPISENAIDSIERSSEPIIVHDPNSHIVHSSFRAYYLAKKIRSCVYVPIFLKGKTSAVLIIYSLKDDTFDEDQKTFFSAFAQQAGVALDNAYLFRQMMEQKDHAEKRSRTLEKENIYLRERIHNSFMDSFITGNSSSMKQVMDLVEKVSNTSATVIIYGETGTGKEIVANLIHTMSQRSNGPLIKVNCPAIPEDLIESELFGHRRGAFTSAYEKRIGMFELAQGGTIFFDEIGDLSLKTQTKLLRVLQEKEIQPLGSPTSIRVDVRIIAATNKDLQKKTEQKSFRDDLFYRLNVFPITLPPLRERREDLPEYISFFMNKYSHLKGNKCTFSQDAMNILINYSWPGNIRELENLVERVLIVSKSNTIKRDDLPREILNESNLERPVKRLSEAIHEFKRDLVSQTLVRTGGKKSDAAKMLGLPRSNFSRLLKSLELPY